MAEEFSDYESVWESYGYCLLRTSYAMEKTMYQELGLLLTKSGSTGSPKLVRQSYKNILSNAESIAEYLELTADEKPISTKGSCIIFAEKFPEMPACHRLICQ